MEAEISKREAKRQYDAMLRARAPRDKAEKTIVREMGEWMGYGRVMQLCEEVWREETEYPGSEHTTGPCAAFMVPCPHPIKDDNGHCDICCGSGRITKGVAKLLTVKTE